MSFMLDNDPEPDEEVTPRTVLIDCLWATFCAFCITLVLYALGVI